MNDVKKSMNDVKDRFGGELRLVEKGREDQSAAEQDRQSIEKLRTKGKELEAAAKGLREAVAALPTRSAGCAAVCGHAAQFGQA